MKEDDTSKMSDFERLPERLTSGGATYYRMWSSSVGAQYVNERDQSDVLSITTIYSFTGNYMVILGAVIWFSNPILDQSVFRVECPDRRGSGQSIEVL